MPADVNSAIVIRSSGAIACAGSPGNSKEVLTSFGTGQANWTKVVNSATAGNGIQITPGTTGDITIKNSGVLNVSGGTDIDVNCSNGNCTVSYTGTGGGGGGGGSDNQQLSIPSGSGVAHKIAIQRGNTITLTNASESKCGLITSERQLIKGTKVWESGGPRCKSSGSDISNAPIAWNVAYDADPAQNVNAYGLKGSAGGQKLRVLMRSPSGGGGGNQTCLEISMSDGSDGASSGGRHILLNVLDKYSGSEGLRVTPDGYISRKPGTRSAANNIEEAVASASIGDFWTKLNQLQPSIARQRTYTEILEDTLTSAAFTTHMDTDFAETDLDHQYPVQHRREYKLFAEDVESLFPNLVTYKPTSPSGEIYKYVDNPNAQLNPSDPNYDDEPLRAYQDDVTFVPSAIDYDGLTVLTLVGTVNLKNTKLDADLNTVLSLLNVSSYVDEAAAIAGGLTSGKVYYNTTDSALIAVS